MPSDIGGIWFYSEGSGESRTPKLYTEKGAKGFITNQKKNHPDDKWELLPIEIDE